MAVTGTVTVGDESFAITDGLGLRDHSWGPRYWQNIWWYRWLTVNLGPDLGFATTVSGDEADRRRVGGFLYDRARHGRSGCPSARSTSLGLRRALVPLGGASTVHTDHAPLRGGGRGVVEHPAAQLAQRHDAPASPKGMTRWRYATSKGRACRSTSTRSWTAVRSAPSTATDGAEVDVTGLPISPSTDKVWLAPRAKCRRNAPGSRGPTFLDT